MRRLFGCALLIVLGIAAFTEAGANRSMLGTTGYDLLRIAAWALMVVGGLLAAVCLIDRAASQMAAASGKQGQRDAHPLFVGWPPTRLDLFSIVAFGVVGFAAVEREWIMVGIALFAILVAMVLPRMRDEFELSGPVKLKGILRDEPAPRLSGVIPANPLPPGGNDRPDQPLRQDPPETTQHLGD